MKFTNVKKWLSMLLVVCSMLSLVACGNSGKDPAGDDSEKGTKVAVVFASSGLGDKSFNDALYDGMKKAESTMGIQWVYSEPKDDAEYEGLISGYADSGDCDLIICLGGSQSSSLENVAPNYPQQKFVILDAVVEGDNIRSYTWRDQELGFLAGFLGAPPLLWLCLYHLFPRIVKLSCRFQRYSCPARVSCSPCPCRKETRSAWLARSICSWV